MRASCHAHIGCDVTPHPERRMPFEWFYAETHGRQRQRFSRPTKDSLRPHPQSLHLCTGWNCLDKGDSAGGLQDKACLRQRWEDGCTAGFEATAPGMRHRETTAPKGSKLHPLNQGDRIVCLGRPRRT